MNQDDKKLYAKVGNKITYYRKHRGMTQRELADILDVDESYISKIETAKNGISIPMLFTIAKAINTPAHKLIDFSDLDGI